MKLTSGILRAALLTAAVFTSTAALATGQVADIIRLDGKEEALLTNPLDSYIATHPQLLPKSESGLTLISSGNWRGYVATWSVREGSLLLVRLGVSDLVPELATGDDPYVIVEKDVLSKAFPGAHEVEASWYTGALVVPRGKLVQYVHMGYGSTSERYTILQVRSGKVVSRSELSLDDFLAYRREKFQQFRQTTEYKQSFDDLTKGNYPRRADEANAFIMAFYADKYLSAAAP